MAVKDCKSCAPVYGKHYCKSCFFEIKAWECHKNNGFCVDCDAQVRKYSGEKQMMPQRDKMIREAQTKESN